MIACGLYHMYSRGALFLYRQVIVFVRRNCIWASPFDDDACAYMCSYYDSCHLCLAYITTNTGLLREMARCENRE